VKISKLCEVVLFACVVASGPLAATASEGKRAFEIADYYRTAMVGSPTVSADGTRVAFPVTRYDVEAGESWSEIWMAGIDGADLRRMTSGRHHDSSPLFSPDGKNLLFVSDRNEGSQLYLMPVDGGEARRLTDYPMGLAGPVWSPDGRWIAVHAEVHPECGYDAECNRTIADSTAAGPLTARMTDDLLYRHWTAWRDGKYAHVLLVDAERGEVVRDLTPGRWDSPTFALGDSGGYAFSPDGAELCVVSNHDREHGWDGNPVYSPSGRYIAFLSQETSGHESDLWRIALYDRRSKKTRYLTDHSNFDNWINDLEWSADERWLYFSGHEKGETPVYRLDLEGGGLRKVFADGSVVGWGLADGGRSIVYVRSKVGSPPELFSVLVEGGATTRLTHFNDALAAEVDIRPAEVMWVEGAEGRKIQVFLVTPHDFDPKKKYPLILNVHGGPSSPWKDRYRGDWQVYPGKGYVVAFPNPTGSAGFGQDFVDAITCDWGGRVYDDLMKVTDALEVLPYVDAERVGAMGWSYGGYIMMWFAGHTDRFEAIASMMGVYDLRSMWGATEELWFVEHDLCGLPWNSEHYEKWSPSVFAEHFKTPTLVITGERDYRVPYTQSPRACTFSPTSRCGRCRRGW